MLLALSMRVAVQMRRFARPDLNLRPVMFSEGGSGMNAREVHARADGLTIGENLAWDGCSERRGEPT
jgi:hypothetical protein